jgi:hypothetical protein
MNENNQSLFVKKINENHWEQSSPRLDWAADLEAGRVLHFDSLPFTIYESEQSFFDSKIQMQGVRNISLDSKNKLKGMNGTTLEQEALTQFILRFRGLAHSLVNTAFPQYKEHLRVAPTSFRPNHVETRTQSVRADDKRLHVDAFPTRPNYGERILRVFLNVNPHGKPRVWRIGEPFEDIAKQFVPKIKPYSKWQASMLNALGITKSHRSEYDHLMLGIHDGMKMSDLYQLTSRQITYNFAPRSVWVCFSDQTAHAVMAGQFMMEQTYHLPITVMYDPDASPLAILKKITQKALV